MGHNWTSEDDENLRRAWGEGLSDSQIAAKFFRGVSRNAIIGRRNRLGLKRKAGERAGYVRGPRPTTVAERTAGIKTLPAPRETEQAHIPPPPPPPPAPRVAEPPSVRIVVRHSVVATALLNRGPRECCFPLGEVGDDDFRYCCKPVGTIRDGYCDEHAAVFKAQPTSLKARLAWALQFPEHHTAKRLLEGHQDSPELAAAKLMVRETA